MKNDLDDLLNQVFGRRSSLPALHTDRPAKEAKPLKASRPAGEAAGRGKPAGHAAAAQPSGTKAAPAKAPAAASQPEAGQAIEAVQQNVLDMQRALDARIAGQRGEIARLNDNALEDIQRIQRELASPQVQALAGEPVSQPAASRSGTEGFAGLERALQAEVLGQEGYCRALAIALKRPYVMGYAGEGPRGSFLISGPADTGRHLGLTAAARFLAQAGVFADEAVQRVDLSLYPSAAEEKLFLQDLYRAFAAPGEIVVFENEDACHTGFLTVLGDLVCAGSYALPGRYVQQNGRLVDAGSALAKEALSRLTPRGKYLVLLTGQSPAQVAGRFGGPFLSALGDVCVTVPFTPEARQAIARKEMDALAGRAGAQLSLALTASGDALALLAGMGPKGQQGCTALLDACRDLYRAMAQYRLTADAPSGDDGPLPCALDAQEGRFTLAFGGGQPVQADSLLPARYQGDLAAVKAQLEQIVGLGPVKEYILSLEQNFAAQRRRAAAGLKTASVSMHMIFTGNPGTGKTTIARLVGQYLKAIGALSGGQLVEVTRADLVGRFVGHTAPQTTAVIRSALGGVLFIDEAYSLYRGKDDNFGLEAIDTLVKEMEDHRDDLVVILAGYTREMADFLSANSGLKSRFPNMIEFPDYTGQELLQIARIQVKSKGYVLDERCDAPLLTYFNAVQLARARQAGNGRLARNKVEEAILAQSRRIAADPAADLSILLPEDFDLTDVNG